MSGRESMLQAIRKAVAAGNHGAAPPHPERNGVGYQGAGVDPVERFCQEFAVAGGTVHQAADAKEAADIVLSLVQAKAARRVLLGSDLEARAEALTRAGVEISRAAEGDKAEYFVADVGVSGVDYLIAETGSVVMLTRPDQPRSLSLLPPVHIAVARRAQIV